MASTGAALGLTGLQAWAAWVGDSRIHIIREGQIHQLTEDQTLVRAMMKRGMLTPEQAAKHPERNVLLHVLGHKKEPGSTPCGTKPLAVQSGDYVSAHLGRRAFPGSPADLCETVTRPLDLEEAAARLIGWPSNAAVTMMRPWY